MLQCSNLNTVLAHSTELLPDSNSTTVFKKDVKTSLVKYIFNTYKYTYIDFFKKLQQYDVKNFIEEESIKQKYIYEVIKKNYNKLSIIKDYCLELNYNAPKWFTTKTYHYTKDKIGGYIEKKFLENESSKEHTLYVNCMNLEFDVSLSNAISFINKLILNDIVYSHFVPITNKKNIELNKSIIPVKTLYVFPVVIQHCYYPKKYPPLLYTNELFIKCKKYDTVQYAMILQMIGVGIITASYTMLGDTIYITFYFEHFEKAKKFTVFIQTIKINKYIYDEPNAIFWNWYGGYIPINYNSNETLVNDSGLNEFGLGWLKYSKVPIYVNVIGLLYKKIDDIEIKIFPYNCDIFKKEIIERREFYSSNVINKILDSNEKNSTIKKKLAILTNKYNVLCDILHNSGINPETIFNKEQHYSKYHIIKFGGTYHKQSVDLDLLEKQFIKSLEKQFIKSLEKQFIKSLE